MLWVFKRTTSFEHPKHMFNQYKPGVLFAEHRQTVQTRPEVIKLFSCSTQLSTKFILLINVKMPTFVGILTFISMINTTSERL